MFYARYLFEVWLTLIDIRRILRKTGLWNFVHFASVSDFVLPRLTLLMLVLFLGVQIVCKWTGFQAFRKNILPPSLLPSKWLDITSFFETFETQPNFTLFQGYYIRICIFKVLLIWKYYVSVWVVSVILKGHFLVFFLNPCLYYWDLCSALKTRDANHLRCVSVTPFTFL